MTYWKTPEFKALQKAWYQRLEAEGFRDIEETVGEELVLKQASSHAYRNDDEMTREIKESYYRLLSQKVHEEPFRRDVDRLILAWRAEGKTINAICSELKLRGTSRARHSIRFIIRRYENQWGLRKYTPRQLNRKVS